MAVVFISPRQRQRMFIMGITIMFLLFLAVVFFGVFLVKTEEVSPALVFNKPKVTINMSIFESEQFKSLQTFPAMDIQYSYSGFAKNKKLEKGFVSAASKTEAKNILESRGLTISEADLKEVENGRDNPFAPYFPIASKITTQK